MTDAKHANVLPQQTARPDSRESHDRSRDLHMLGTDVCDASHLLTSCKGSAPSASGVRDWDRVEGLVLYWDGWMDWLYWDGVEGLGILGMGGGTGSTGTGVEGLEVVLNFPTLSDIRWNSGRVDEWELWGRPRRPPPRALDTTPT